MRMPKWNGKGNFILGHNSFSNREEKMLAKEKKSFRNSSMYKSQKQTFPVL